MRRWLGKKKKSNNTSRHQLGGLTQRGTSEHARAFPERINEQVKTSLQCARGFFHGGIILRVAVRSRQLPTEHGQRERASDAN